LLDLPLVRSFVFPLALRLTLGLALGTLILAASRLRVILSAAALRSSLRCPGRRAPGLGALSLRRAWGAYPFLRSILMLLHLRLRLRRTPLPLHRLLLLLLLV
jgi:hypothetical protein